MQQFDFFLIKTVFDLFASIFHAVIVLQFKFEFLMYNYIERQRSSTVHLPEILLL